MRNTFLLFSLVLLCFALSESRIALAEGRTRIGVLTPLTGEGSTWGLDIRDALLFANAKFGNDKYELVFEDDKCSPKEGVSAAQKLIAVEKVKYVTGFGCSGVTLSTAPLFEKAGVVAMVTVASSPRIAKAGELVFRTWPSDAKAAELLYRLVDGSKYSSIGVISAESDYTQDFKNGFLAATAGSKAAVITEDYLPDATDLRPQLLRLRAKAPQAIFINAQFEGTFAVILKQMREMKWSPKVYGAYYPSSPALAKLAQADLEGVEFVDVPDVEALLTAEGRRLYAEYVSTYGKPRSVNATFASVIEGFRSLIRAIEQAKPSSSQAIADYLYHSRFEGIFGEYRFDADGEIQGLQFQLKRINRGAIEGIPVPFSPSQPH